MLRVLMPALLLLPACARDLEAILDEIDGLPHATASTGSETSTAPTSTGGGHASTGDEGQSGAADSTTGSSVTSSLDLGGVGETGAASSTGGGQGGEVMLPEVLAIELPEQVNAAGPVPITVQAKAASCLLYTSDAADE